MRSAWWCAILAAHGAARGASATYGPGNCPADVAPQVAVDPAEVPLLEAQVSAAVPASVRQMLATGVVPAGWNATAMGRGILSVGVIGAGPSGLVSAKLLSEAGFQVTVFEAGPRVGGKANTIIDPTTGRAQDLATKWIPTVSARDPQTVYVGVPPLQEAIIRDVEQVYTTLTNTTLRRGSPGIMIYNTLTNQPLRVPPIVSSACSTTRMLSDFIIGLNYFIAMTPCAGVASFAGCGFANLTESLEEWGRARHLECFTKLLADFVDMLGDGMAQAEFAGYALKTRSYFLIGQLLKILAAYGLFLPDPPAEVVELKSMLPPMGAWSHGLSGADIDAIVASKSFVTFEQGYNGFWELFVQRYGLDVRLSEAAVSVAPGSGNVGVTTSEGQYSFHHVIVAAPPKDMPSFMPAEYAPYWDPVVTIGVESTAWKVASPLPTNRTAVLYPANCETNMGGSGGAVRNGRIYVLGDEYRDGLITAMCYPTPGNATEGASPCDPGILSSDWGYQDVQLVNRSYREWPSVIGAPAYAGFHGWVEANQGKHGLSFVGEELAGNNVPAIIDHVSAFFVSNAWLEPAAVSNAWPEPAAAQDPPADDMSDVAGRRAPSLQVAALGAMAALYAAACGTR